MVAATRVLPPAVAPRVCPVVVPVVVAAQAASAVAAEQHVRRAVVEWQKYPPPIITSININYQQLH